MKSSVVFFSVVLSMASIPFAPPLVYAQSAAKAQEEQLYKNGTAAMDSAQWQKAMDLFSQIKGSKADAALYWKSYAQNKLGERTAALETIGLLTKQYPKSKWIKDAKALEVEIQGAAGQAPPPAESADEDLKLYAINGLMNSDPEAAIPLLEQVLSVSQSSKVKDRALFVLSQSSSPRAQELMAKIARGEVQPDLQVKAIQNLGISGKKKLLSDIYASGVGVDAKRAVLRAMGIAGARDELSASARSERDAQLRREAINGLAIAGGREQLRQLYKETSDPQTKRDLIHSAVITGDQQLLMDVVQNESDSEVKRDAVRTMGVAGGREEVAVLVNVYNMDKDVRTREAAIDGLFVRGAAHEMLELAKKETDPEMKKRLFSKLSIMNNKEVTDYLIQVLEK